MKKRIVILTRVNLQGCDGCNVGHPLVCTDCRLCIALDGQWIGTRGYSSAGLTGVIYKWIYTFSLRDRLFYFQSVLFAERSLIWLFVPVVEFFSPNIIQFCIMSSIVVYYFRFFFLFFLLLR